MFLVVKYQTRKDEIYTLNILLINGKVKYCLAKNMLNNDFIVKWIPYIWIIYTDYITSVTMQKDLLSRMCFFPALQRHLNPALIFSLVWEEFSSEIFPVSYVRCQMEFSLTKTATVSKGFPSLLAAALNGIFLWL